MAVLDRNPKQDTRNLGVLQASPLLSGLSLNALDRLLSKMTIEILPARTVIAREGDRADAFYCVLSGYVRLYRHGPDGREADIMVASAGNTFAECLLFGERIYRFTAETAGPTTLACFDMQAVHRLAHEEPEVARGILSSVSRNLQGTIDCITNDRLFTAPQRVAHYILSRCPVDGGAASIRLPFQKSLLAGMLGLAPEALSRAFSTLRRAGVTVKGRIIQVGDVQTLRNTDGLRVR